MNLVYPHKHPRLLLPLPAGASWRMENPGPNLHVAVVDEHVRIRVRALVAPTVEHTEWVRGVLAEELPEGAVVVPIEAEARTSTRGWPLYFARHEIRSSSGALLEERVGAFYGIVHNRAEVVAILSGGVRWSDRAETLRPFMLSAHVEWPSTDDDLLFAQLGYRP